MSEYIYKMSWYDSKRHTVSNTDMYYLYEGHTRWGHNWPEGCNGSQRCEIRVRKVNKNSTKYKMAVENSIIASKNELTAIKNYIKLLEGRPGVKVGHWDYNTKERVLYLLYEDLNNDWDMNLTDFTFEELLEDGLERI